MTPPSLRLLCLPLPLLPTPRLPEAASSKPVSGSQAVTVRVLTERNLNLKERCSVLYTTDPPHIEKLGVGWVSLRVG